ncbi:hypothetical protein GO986_00635 [Deinococcus sp. HMF7620]|uniref:Uncharacterized protein n=1 Tax=Deinococcus arboris TaxID=2682977 RepID=A0A7C9LL03_9DEIO|nr:hypothetical protein [Deinococcus arboris]MVN85276.1 hypothetical protein [Deinococcus arboris]
MAQFLQLMREDDAAGARAKLIRQGFRPLPSPQINSRAYANHHFEGELFGGAVKITLSYHPDTLSQLDDIVAVPAPQDTRTARQLCAAWTRGLTDLWNRRPEDFGALQYGWATERAVLDCTGSPKDKIDLLVVWRPQPSTP